ncbi:Sensor histidine kinase YpdA [compost metagenome]
MRNTGLAMMAGTLLLSILFIIFFVNRMTNRIRNLVRVMSSVKKGTLTKAPESDIQDEVGMLTTSFNLMVDGLDNSIQENMRVQLSLKDAEIKKQEAELYALQSQINPHFLFNTLESIRMKLLVLPQNETASNMIFSLSKILRKALNWKHDIIPLREELEFVRNYLDIQKSRFRDKIEDQLEVEEALMDYPIPKLIIQPLVENSIKHGIERKKGRGHIWISVQSGHQGIEVVVKDDGLGIPPDRLAHLQETLGMRREERPERESIGIVNVHDRVVLHYGEGYGLQIESEEQLGTIIRIRLPRGGE